MEPCGSGAEEIGFAVADRLRGCGIGTALMAEAIESARRAGVLTQTATMFASNEPMRRLVLDAGPPVKAHPLEAGTAQYDLDLTGPIGTNLARCHRLRVAGR
jgi:GNAT superfamily N-acetyltransferase